MTHEFSRGAIRRSSSKEVEDQRDTIVHCPPCRARPATSQHARLYPIRHHHVTTTHRRAIRIRWSRHHHAPAHPIASFVRRCCVRFVLIAGHRGSARPPSLKGDGL